MDTQLKAFLDMIAASELGQSLLDISDNGYNVLVGSTPANPLLFSDYSTHPHILNSKFNSTAAGRYQELYRNYVVYKEKLGLPDFGPDSQDAMAIQQITECGAIKDILAGQLEIAVAKCAHLWASFPAAGYGQHENKFAMLCSSFVSAGGKLSDGGQA